MSNANANANVNAGPRVGPPTGATAPCRLAGVCPTLTLIDLLLGDWLRDHAHPVLRTFVLATVAVPIVIYGLMPQLQGARRTDDAHVTRVTPPAL